MLRLRKSSTDGYRKLLKVYAQSPFGNLESYLRMVVGLDGISIQIILKQYTFNFVTYGIFPGI